MGLSRGLWHGCGGALAGSSVVGDAADDTYRGTTWPVGEPGAQSPDRRRLITLGETLASVAPLRHPISSVPTADLVRP